VKVVIVIRVRAPFSSDNNELSEKTSTKSNDVEIKEMFESRNNPARPSTASEPIIIEQKEVPEMSNGKKLDMVIEISAIGICLQAIVIKHMYAL